VGWRHAFQIFGGLGVIWAVLFYRWYRNNPLDNPRLNAGGTGTGAPGERQRTPARRHAVGEVPGVAAGVDDLPAILLSFLRLVFLHHLAAHLPGAGAPPECGSVAIFGIAPLFMGGLGNLASVFLANRFAPWVGSMAQTRRIMAYIGFTGASMFLLLSTRMNDPLAAVLSIGLASFSNDLVMPGAWAACMDVGGKHAGSLSGMMNMMGNVGGALCPLVIGYILYWTHNNWNLTFYVSAAIYLMGIVCWMFLDPVDAAGTLA
jgi:ACS family glucarate transporter-like MFS transporter